MDIENAISGRRSIRKFIPEPVPDEVITKLVAMAMEAPSPGNQQGRHFYAIRQPEMLEHMATLVKQEIQNIIATAAKNPESLHGPVRFATWFAEAPAVLAVTTEVYRSRLDQTLLAAGYSDEEVDNLRCRPDLQAVGAAVQNLLLAAHALGYGACWLTGPLVARPELEDYLGIRHPRTLTALIALGRPENQPPRPQKKSVGELITFL